MKGKLKIAMFALTAAYVALLPQFYMMYGKQGRYDMLWDFTYYGAIVTSVLLLACAYGTGYLVFFRLWKVPKPWQTAREYVLVLMLAYLATRMFVALALGSPLTAGIREVLDSLPAKIEYYIAIPLLVTALNRPRAMRAMQTLYIALAPAVLVGLVWPLGFKSYDRQDPPVPMDLASHLGSGAARGTTNVFIFIMDEWSYERTFPGDKLRDDMPELRSLLGQSTLYHDARSPGAITFTSIPRFLYQNNPVFRLLTFDQVHTKYEDALAVAGPSIFAESPPDWFKMALGFRINYVPLLGTNVDFAFEIIQEAGTRTYRRNTERLLMTQLGFTRYVWPDLLDEKLDPGLLWILSLRQTHRWSKMVIEQVDRPVFGFFHYCLPHFPYVWNRNGLKLPLPAKPTEQTVENYQDNLMYLDRVVGELVKSLKSAQKFDQSMIIFTSDHSWRWDPLHNYPGWGYHDFPADSEVRHVPLIVKFPGQREHRDVYARVYTADTYLMIRDTLRRLGIGPSGRDDDVTFATEPGTP